MLIPPEALFEESRAWRQMASLASESTWGWAAISIGSFRLGALIVNGTFADTWYGRRSPHVRSLASFLSCFLCCRSASVWLAAELPTTGLAVYPGLLVLDLMNVVAAASDAAKMDKAQRDGR